MAGSLKDSRVSKMSIESVYIKPRRNSESSVGSTRETKQQMAHLDRIRDLPDGKCALLCAIESIHANSAMPGISSLDNNPMEKIINSVVKSPIEKVFMLKFFSS